MRYTFFAEMRASYNGYYPSFPSWYHGEALRNTRNVHSLNPQFRTYFFETSERLRFPSRFLQPRIFQYASSICKTYGSFAHLLNGLPDLHGVAYATGMEAHHDVQNDSGSESKRRDGKDRDNAQSRHCTS